MIKGVMMRGVLGEPKYFFQRLVIVPSRHYELIIWDFFTIKSFNVCAINTVVKINTIHTPSHHKETAASNQPTTNFIAPLGCNWGIKNYDRCKGAFYRRIGQVAFWQCMRVMRFHVGIIYHQKMKS